MMPRKRTLMSLGTLWLAAVGSAWAGAPDLISYQGRLQENGALVNGNRSVNIRLCDALSGGTCYPTGSQGVAVANGIFRTTFTTTALPVGGLNSGSWFIEVMVSGNALSPREQFASAPYALVASSVPASGISAGVVGSGVHFGANVGIGITNPADLLSLRGFSPRIDFRSSGGSTSGPGLRLWHSGGEVGGRDYTLYSGGSGDGSGLGTFGVYDWTAGQDRLVIDAAGRVGIGTTTPLQRFHVFGGNQTISQVQSNVSGATDVGFRITTPDREWDIQQNPLAIGVGKLGIRDVTSGGTGASVRLTIDTAGNVGIGITNPAAPLNVVGPAGNAAIFETTGFNQVEMRSTASTPQTVSLSLASWSPSQSGLRQMAAIDTVPGGHLVLKTTNEGATGGTARLTVAASGNVGIGLTNPGANLQVAGNTILGTSGTSMVKLLHGTCNSGIININAGATAVVTCAAPGVSATDRVFVNSAGPVLSAIVVSAVPGAGSISVTLGALGVSANNPTDMHWMAISP